jgi:beta-N-acetylhexosaminidase
VGEALAEELGACGIRWDFAPVVDVDTNPRNPVIGDRSLGDDPGLVGRLAAEIIRGMQGRGVAACAKHFPGLGDSELDPHLDLPALDHSRSRLDDIELRPFRAAAEAGVASVMTAHVMARELDDQLPATLSARVLSDLLRDEMGYDGLVVSDDLEMKAVSARWGPGVAAVLAVKAGCDMVIVSRDHDAQVEAVEGMVRAMETGEISWRAADDAARRIREIKERFLLPYADPSPAEARAAAGSQERWALARTLADLGGVAV